MPAVRTAVLTDAAVSYGVGERPSAHYLVAATEAHLPVVQRTTGGSGLLHAPGDLAWSVILPRTDPRVGTDYVHAYGRLGAGVVAFLAERKVVARWTDPPGTSPDYCILSARGSVLAVGDRVLGGAAQHLSAEALLHHGILPTGLNRPMLARLFRLSDRQLRSLTSLRELGVTDPPEQLAWKLAASLADSLAPARA